MSGYRVEGTFVAVVPGAVNVKDAGDIVRDGLNIDGSVHGQRIVGVTITVVEEEGP